MPNHNSKNTTDTNFTARVCSHAGCGCGIRRGFHIKIRMKYTSHPFEWEIRAIVQQYFLQRSPNPQCRMSDATQLPHHTAQTRISPIEIGFTHIKKCGEIHSYMYTIPQVFCIHVEKIQSVNLALNEFCNYFPVL